jgi:hypothetical protein
MDAAVSSEISEKNSIKIRKTFRATRAVKN